MKQCAELTDRIANVRGSSSSGGEDISSAPSDAVSNAQPPGSAKGLPAAAATQQLRRQHLLSGDSLDPSEDPPLVVQPNAKSSRVVGGGTVGSALLAQQQQQPLMMKAIGSHTSAPGVSSVF